MGRHSRYTPVTKDKRVKLLNIAPPEIGERFYQKYKRTKHCPVVEVLAIEQHGLLRLVRMRNVETGRISSANFERFVAYPLKYERLPKVDSSRSLNNVKGEVK